MLHGKTAAGCKSITVPVIVADREMPRTAFYGLFATNLTVFSTIAWLGSSAAPAGNSLHSSMNAVMSAFTCALSYPSFPTRTAARARSKRSPTV